MEEQAAPYLSDTGYVPTTVSEDIYKGIKFAQLERGMVVLHGDAGIGKTEGARKFLHDYPHSTVFITATPTTGSLNCIIKLLARALGVPEMRGRMDTMLAIREKLAGTNKVVIIDEAQHLRLPALEELRTLSDPDIVTGVPGNGVCLIGNHGGVQPDDGPPAGTVRAAVQPHQNEPQLHHTESEKGGYPGAVPPLGR